MERFWSLAALRLITSLQASLIRLKFGTRRRGIGQPVPVRPNALVSFQCSSAERCIGANWRRRRSGPLNNLNAEIYYPSYLYKNDGSGQPAIRPVITAATPQSLLPGNTVNLTVGPADQISRLTFVRAGSSTHCNNSDQRFINLTFNKPVIN